MSRVLGPHPLRTERCPDAKRKLLRGITVCVASTACREKKTGEVDRISVPKGFITDYSSVPSIGRALIPWFQVDVAGVVHDYLYSSSSTAKYPRVSRRDADEYWRRIACSGGDPRVRLVAWKAWLCWLLLRAWSHRYWRK